LVRLATIAKQQLAKAQAEIARLRTELARHPPRPMPVPVGKTAEERADFKLDELYKPYIATPEPPRTKLQPCHRWRFNRSRTPSVIALGP
jgi:hypothetical protein